MFGIRSAVKYAVENGMLPWIVHQSQQGGTLGRSGMLYQLRHTLLQHHAEVRFGDRPLWPLPAQYQGQRMSVQQRDEHAMRKKVFRNGKRYNAGLFILSRFLI